MNQSISSVVKFFSPLSFWMKISHFIFFLSSISNCLLSVMMSGCFFLWSIKKTYHHHFFFKKNNNTPLLSLFLSFLAVALIRFTMMNTHTHYERERVSPFFSYPWLSFREKKRKQTFFVFHFLDNKNYKFLDEKILNSTMAMCIFFLLMVIMILMIIMMMIDHFDLNRFLLFFIVEQWP